MILGYSGVHSSVLPAYLDLIHMRQSYNLTEQSLILSKNNLEFKSQQHKSGDISNIELEKAKLEYSKFEFNLKKIQISISNQEDLILDYIDIVPDTVDYPDLVNGNIDLAPVSLIEYALNNNPSISTNNWRTKTFKSKT